VTHLQLIKFWPSCATGKGSAAGDNFWLPPYDSQRAVFASLSAFFISIYCSPAGSRPSRQLLKTNLALLHESKKVHKGSDHLQLIKFWPGRWGENFWLRLTTASAQCLRLSERFFITVVLFAALFSAVSRCFHMVLASEG